MPTAARLVAAVCLAALAWVVSDLVMDVVHQRTDRTEFGLFKPLNIVLGFMCGWVVIGKRVGTDYVTSLSIGLTGVAALVFWSLFFMAGNEMLRLSLARRYDGPIEALVAAFQIGIDYGRNLSDLRVLLTLFVGGMVIGVLAEFTNRRWR